MRIISIHIDEFGMLDNRDFSFAPGMNILEGRNESGKSTLLAFIKFMLYGAPARGTGEAIPERMRRLNWRTGRAAGSMTIAVDAGEYRIERSLVRTVSGNVETARESFTEHLQVIDLQSGTPLPRGTLPGEYFLGVPLSVFESTAFVRQLGASGIDGGGVSEALENLLTSASESSNTARALGRLDAVRKTLLHKNGKGGEIYTLQAERTGVASRLARAKAAGRDRIAAQTLLDGLKKSAAESREKLTQLNARCDASDALMLLRRFESLHALEKKTADLRGALRELRDSEGAGDFFPDRVYTAHLRDLEHRIGLAEADCARAETELARMRYEQPGDPHRAELAGNIRTAGGIDALTGRYAALAQAAKSLRGYAVLCFVLGAICILGGAALALLMPSWVGYGAAALGLPLLAGGIACLHAARQRRDALAELCRQYDLPDTAEEDAFAERLGACFAEEEQLKGYAEVLTQIEDDLAGKQKLLDALRREALDALAQWDIAVVDGGLAEALSAAIPRAERDAECAEDLLRDLSKYDAVWQNTAAELADEDEALLRRRVEAAGVDPNELNITLLRRERDFVAKGLEAVEAKRIETEKQLIALDATAENPIQLAAALDELDRRLAELTARHEAVQLAASALNDAAESLRRGILPRLRARAGEILSAITDGRYAGVGLGQGMALSVEAGEGVRRVELLSAGTADAAYLALRLALLELLYPNEMPPILLDESLVQLDDDRASAMLGLLQSRCAEGGQCLLFTCQPREARLCDAAHTVLG